MNKFTSVILYILKTFLKYTLNCLLISLTIGITLATLWFLGLVGSECATLGKGCFVTGFKIDYVLDSIAHLYLQAWTLPIVGVVAGPLWMIIVGPVFGWILFPFIFGGMLTLRAIQKKPLFQKS